jgi:predicted aspartyl protease
MMTLLQKWVAIVALCAVPFFAGVPLNAQEIPLISLPPSAPKPVSQIAPDAETETMLETGSDSANRMTVAVMINGTGPYQFIVDTGSSRSVISAELAAKLALPDGKFTRINTMSGVDKVSTVLIDTLQVSNKTVRNIIAPALLTRNLGADGILGLDALENTRVTIDFRANVMTVAVATKVSAAPDEPGTIVVSARSRFGQLILVDADAFDQKIFVVLDTGAQNSVGNTKLRRLLERSLTKPMRPIQMVSVTGGITLADYTTIAAVRVGGVKINNAPMAFADVHPFRKFELTRRPAMLLGMDVLRSFNRVSIDFPNRKIRFLVPRAGKDVPNRFAALPAPQLQTKSSTDIKLRVDL